MDMIITVIVIVGIAVYLFGGGPRRRPSTWELRLSAPMPLPSIAFSSEPPLLRDKAAAADFHHGVEQRLAIHQTSLGTSRDR